MGRGRRRPDTDPEPPPARQPPRSSRGCVVILLFPTPDALRQALTSGAFREVVRTGPVRAGFGDRGRVWVELTAPWGRRKWTPCFGWARRSAPAGRCRWITSFIAGPSSCPSSGKPRPGTRATGLPRCSTRRRTTGQPGRRNPSSGERPAGLPLAAGRPVPGPCSGSRSRFFQSLLRRPVRWGVGGYPRRLPRGPAGCLSKGS